MEYFVELFLGRGEGREGHGGHRRHVAWGACGMGGIWHGGHVAWGVAWGHVAWGGACGMRGKWHGGMGSIGAVGGGWYRTC